MYDVAVTRMSGASTTPVVIDLTTPASVGLDVIPPGCTLLPTGRTVRCDLGVIDTGGRGVVELVVDPRSEGPHVGTVELATPDDNPAGNLSSATATPDFLCDNDFTFANDTVTGTTGSDILCGGGGADRLTGGLGDDKLFGGSGIDTITYSAATARMVFDLALQDGYHLLASPYNILQRADGYDAATSIETLIATPFADVIVGRPERGATWEPTPSTEVATLTRSTASVART